MNGRYSWLVPLGLFVLALGVRLLVVPLVQFAPTEGAQYYLGVAEHLVGGRGLVSDAVWSYATPPHVVPEPAFELWLPMATFVAAIPMIVAGATLPTAQAAMALLGATVAPLAWWVGREAATANGLDARRTRAAAIGAGLLSAVLAPFVMAVAGPDSTTPFLVFGTVAAVLGPRALPGPAAARPRSWLTGLGFGAALGLAYLSRQEAVWIALAWLLLLAGGLRGRSGGRARAFVGALGPVLLGGLLAIAPWLLRNVVDLGGPLPGQAVENLWLERNEDIFAWLDRPTATAYLGRGVGALLSDRLDAVVHQLVAVLVTPAFPVGLLGLLAIVALRRSPAIRRPTALAMLLAGGGLTFLATALLFPVATRWGTFLHSAGPLLVGLIVTTVLAGDALLARISARRRWPRVNVVIAPVALLVVTVPLLILQLLIVSRQADRLDRRFAATAADIAGRFASAGEVDPVIITDHPMWLAASIRGRAIVLPDEAPSAILDLARTYGATWLLGFDDAARGSGAQLASDATACLAAPPALVGPDDDPALLLHLTPHCSAS